jgi:hypothetical protein
MLMLDFAGTVSEVPLTPHSGYAFGARWQSVASDGTRVIAIGAANGGAHSNSRWTTWSGTTAGIEELPQSFDTFGGWGAGDLVDVVVTSAGEAIVGTWGGAKAGLDGAVWLSSGPVWTRQNSAGTALQSTPQLLVGPRSATPDGAGILVAGSALNLVPGSVTRKAALWRSTALNSRWRRLDLPQPGKSSEAVSARCNGEHCIIAGQVDGALAMWDLTGDTATRLAAVPAVAVGDSDPLPDPLIIGGHLVQVAATHGHAVTLTRDGSGWSVSSGPVGAPTTAAPMGGHLYVTVTHGSPNPATLWQADARAWHWTDAVPCSRRRVQRRACAPAPWCPGPRETDIACQARAKTSARACTRIAAFRATDPDADEHPTLQFQPYSTHATSAFAAPM